VASLTPFRFSWTEDKGNGKNPVPSSPCPQLQSIALVAAGRNVARNARGRQKQTEADRVVERQELPSSVRSGNLVTQVVGRSRACFQRATDGVRLSGGHVGSGCKCALWSPHRYTFE
jgi:hypothetical protein